MIRDFSDQVFVTSPRIIERFILMLLEHQGISLEGRGSVLKGCVGYSSVHHDGERKSDLQNKGHKEKIDYKKANKTKIKILLDRNQVSRTKLNYDRNLTIPHAAAPKT